MKAIKKLFGLQTTNYKLRTKKGFTLIEMIVVIGAIGLLLPLLFSIIFAIVRQQVSVYRLAQIKREGDAVLNVMEIKIKNDAFGIYRDPNLTDGVLDPSEEECQEPDDPSFAAEDGNNFYFKDKQDNWFQFKRDSSTQKIVSESVSAGVQTLVSNKVLITEFEISCVKPGDFTAPLVTVSFAIQFNTPSSKPILPYQLTVKLRNE